MLTRVEIDGFKTFDSFSLDLRPFTAIVGPNASGKSNLFDALRFLSLLAQTDIRTAMQDLRGLPEELFRRTINGSVERMSFALEVLLQRKGTDPFGRTYEITAQRLRYELKLGLKRDSGGNPRSVYVAHEHCAPVSRRDDRADYLKGRKLKYNSRISPFIRINDDHDSIEIRQDGRQRHGRPVSLSLNEASRTALSTITTAEFPHLYALREALSSIRFLEINPKAARSSNDQFESLVLKPDASNLAAVLAHLQAETATNLRPAGVLSDISSDMASLIPSIYGIDVKNDQRQFSFSIKFSDTLDFSSRVISDGTIRLLALLTFLNDPRRLGTLCFEEPENGVHEGRIATLVQFLRDASQIPTNNDEATFQILLNTHSPKVMEVLEDEEIVAADTVSSLDQNSRGKSTRTRMRTGVTDPALFDNERHLTRTEINQLLQKSTDAA